VAVVHLPWTRLTNVALGIVPVLEQLLQLSPSTQSVYLCSPCVKHISKLKREGSYPSGTIFRQDTDFSPCAGSFCGYRNIQMLISYIIIAEAAGSDLFGETFPTIFQIQDLIENAWDSGFNAQGRQETGGIKGTRKYIGTPEVSFVQRSSGEVTPVADSTVQAKALFDSLGIKCVGGKLSLYTWSLLINRQQMPCSSVQGSGHR
jgi:hypothetical protein